MVNSDVTFYIKISSSFKVVIFYISMFYFYIEA